MSQEKQEEKGEIAGKQIEGYVIGEMIHEGGSLIYKAFDVYTGRPCVVKVIMKAFINQSYTSIHREIFSLKILKHRNIVTFYQVIESSTAIYIISEYCLGKDLFKHITQKERLTELEALNIFHQLIDAVDYMHQMNIAHRDLRPENIILDSKGSIKLIDFALSSLYDDNDKELLNDDLGCHSYCCPEILLSSPYSGMKCDTWSIGILLYIMLCGCLPFYEEDTEKNRQMIIKGQYDFPQNSLSNQVKDLLSHLIDINPSRRYTMKQIREHAWFRHGSPYALKGGLNVLKMDYPVDIRIVDLCEMYGFDRHKLISQLCKNAFTLGTAVYKQMVRIVKDLNKMSKSDLCSSEYMYYVEDEDNWYDEEEYEEREREMFQNEMNIINKVIIMRDYIEMKEKEAIESIARLQEEFSTKPKDNIESLLPIESSKVIVTPPNSNNHKTYSNSIHNSLSMRKSIPSKTQIDNELYLKRCNTIRRGAIIDANSILSAAQIYLQYHIPSPIPSNNTSLSSSPSSSFIISEDNDLNINKSIILNTKMTDDNQQNDITDSSTKAKHLLDILFNGREYKNIDKSKQGTTNEFSFNKDIYPSVSLELTTNNTKQNSLVGYNNSNLGTRHNEDVKQGRMIKVNSTHRISTGKKKQSCKLGKGATTSITNHAPLSHRNKSSNPHHHEEKTSFTQRNNQYLMDFTKQYLANEPLKKEQQEQKPQVSINEGKKLSFTIECAQSFEVNSCIKELPKALIHLNNNNMIIQNAINIDELQATLSLMQETNRNILKENYQTNRQCFYNVDTKPNGNVVLKQHRDYSEIEKIKEEETPAKKIVYVNEMETKAKSSSRNSKKGLNNNNPYKTSSSGKGTMNSTYQQKPSMSNEPHMKSIQQNQVKNNGNNNNAITVDNRKKIKNKSSNSSNSNNRSSHLPKTISMKQIHDRQNAYFSHNTSRTFTHNHNHSHSHSHSHMKTNSNTHTHIHSHSNLKGFATERNNYKSTNTPKNKISKHKESSSSKPISFPTTNNNSMTFNNYTSKSPTHPDQLENQDNYYINSSIPNHSNSSVSTYHYQNQKQQSILAKEIIRKQILNSDMSPLQELQQKIIDYSLNEAKNNHYEPIIEAPVMIPMEKIPKRLIEQRNNSMKCITGNANDDSHKTASASLMNYDGPIDILCVSTVSFIETIGRLISKLKEKKIQFNRSNSGRHEVFSCNKNGFYFEVEIVTISSSALGYNGYSNNSNRELYYYLIKRKKGTFESQNVLLRELIADGS